MWKVCMADVISQLNTLINAGRLQLSDDTEVDIDFYIGGDYKFLLCVGGLNAASAGYACIYCYCHSTHRWESVAGTPAPSGLRREHLNRLKHTGKKTCSHCKRAGTGPCTSAQSVNEDSEAAGANRGDGFYGQLHESLFPGIPPSRMIPCELHGLMRITDRLEGKLSWSACNFINIGTTKKRE